MQRIFGGDPQNKIKKLMEYAGENKDVADPYWTGDYETAFCDIVRGINGLYNTSEKER